MKKSRLSVPPITGNPGRKKVSGEKTYRQRDLGDEKGSQRGQSGSSQPPLPSNTHEGVKSRSRKKQAPRLKVTVQRPDVLEELSEFLGLNKSAVVNLALKVLAEREGLL